MLESSVPGPVTPRYEADLAALMEEGSSSRQEAPVLELERVAGELRLEDSNALLTGTNTLVSTPPPGLWLTPPAAGATPSLLQSPTQRTELEAEASTVAANWSDDTTLGYISDAADIVTQQLVTGCIYLE